MSSQRRCCFPALLFALSDSRPWELNANCCPVRLQGIVDPQTKLFAEVLIGDFDPRKKATKNVTPFNGTSAQWDEKLLFDIYDGDREAVITVYQSLNGRPTFFGEGVLSFAGLAGWTADEQWRTVPLSPYARDDAGVQVKGGNLEVAGIVKVILRKVGAREVPRASPSALKQPAPAQSSPPSAKKPRPLSANLPSVELKPCGLPMYHIARGKLLGQCFSQSSDKQTIAVHIQTVTLSPVPPPSDDPVTEALVVIGSQAQRTRVSTTTRYNQGEPMVFDVSPGEVATVTLIEVRKHQEFVIGTVSFPLDHATPYNKQDHILTLDMQSSELNVAAALQLTTKLLSQRGLFRPDRSRPVGSLGIQILGASFRSRHARRSFNPSMDFVIDEHVQFQKSLHGFVDESNQSHATEDFEVVVQENQHQAIIQVYDSARSAYREVLGTALLPLQMVTPAHAEVLWVDIVDHISQTVVGYLRLLVTSRLTPPGAGVHTRASERSYYDSVAVTPMRIELDAFSDGESKDIFVMLEVTGQQSSTRCIMEAQLVISWQQQFIFAVTPEAQRRGKLGVYNFKTQYDQLLATCEFDIPPSWESDKPWAGLDLQLISPTTQNHCGRAYVVMQPPQHSLRIPMPLSASDGVPSRPTHHGPRPDKVCVNIFRAIEVTGLKGQPGMYDARVVCTVDAQTLGTAVVRGWASEPFWDAELVYPLPADTEVFTVRLYEDDQILGEAEASLQGFLTDDEHYHCIELPVYHPQTGNQTAILDMIIKEAPPVAPPLAPLPVADPPRRVERRPPSSHRVVDVHVMQAQRLHTEVGIPADRQMYQNLFVQMMLDEDNTDNTNLGKLREGMTSPNAAAAHDVEVPMAIWKEQFVLEVPHRTFDMMFMLFDNSTAPPAGPAPTELGSAILNLSAAFPYSQVTPLPTALRAHFPIRAL